MTQTWSHVYFAHWPVDANLLRPLVPTPLEIDTYCDDAFLSIVAFRVEDARIRLLPPIPTTKQYAQVNVRTYVRHGNKAGIWLFSVDAASALSALGARVLAHLSYHSARGNLRANGPLRLFRSQRVANPVDGSFAVQYQGSGSPKVALRESLEDWLTARFCLFTTAGNRLQRGDIHHLPWPLEHVEANIQENTLLDSLPGRLDAIHPAVSGYAGRLKTYLWGLSTVDQI